MPTYKIEEALVPTPSVDINSMVQRMVEAMFRDVCLDEQMQKAVEKALHDQKGKLQLMLAGVLMQKMMTHSSTVAGAEYGKHLMAQPEYIRRLSPDPEALRKHTESLHNMGKDDEAFFVQMLKNLLDGSAKGGGAPFDPATQFNFLFAEGSTGMVGLPEMLQDRNKRRQFVERATMALSLLQGTIPEPPVKQERLRRAGGKPEIIDVTPIVKSPEAEKGQPDDQAFWDALGLDGKEGSDE